MKESDNNMKKINGFTLVELLAVIIILCITVTIVVVKVDKNIKDANNFGNEMQIENIESSALIYADEYTSSLTNLQSKNVDTITISTLINSGLLNSKDVKDISTSDLVLIANINGDLKVKYIRTSKNVIFLNGSKEISLYQGDTYNEMGAYVAIPGTGLVELTSSNILSTVNTSAKGEYKVTYSYSGATSVVRKVSVL